MKIEVYAAGEWRWARVVGFEHDHGMKFRYEFVAEIDGLRVGCRSGSVFYKSTSWRRVSADALR